MPRQRAGQEAGMSYPEALTAREALETKLSPFFCVQCGVQLPAEGAFCDAHAESQAIYPETLKENT